MTDRSERNYPIIYISGTDPDLPSWFSNGFEKYCNFRELGAGGVGVLHACYDKNLGRHVILKRLPKEQASNPRQRRRLLREARVTAQLQHPNTVPVYEIGRDDRGQIYFAMKKIEGENLFRILSRIARGDAETRAAFPLSRLLGIIIHASSALSYAHAHGVIHRDIKPENIMVGLFNEVILMDWGVAKVWGMAEHDDEEDEGPNSDLYQRLTESGKRPGTPLYMSPQQVKGEKILDERTDIFSMGVVLYETVALREPFRGRSIEETFHNILNMTPPPASEVARVFQVPPQLDEVIFKAIAKAPKDRYQSIQQMIDAIRRVRNQGVAD